MSSEVYQIVQKLNPKALETQIIVQCSPMLAGLKASNLLKVNSENESDVSRLFARTGISCILLARKAGKSFFLLYRADMLIAHISRKDCIRLLSSMGYVKMDLASLIEDVRSAYQAYTDGKREFPHELGILLGYPPEDVKGYMDFGGKNALYTGYWQVYENPDAKIRVFQAYESARELMVRQASEGMSLLQIISNSEKNMA